VYVSLQWRSRLLQCSQRLHQVSWQLHQVAYVCRLESRAVARKVRDAACSSLRELPYIFRADSIREKYTVCESNKFIMFVTKFLDIIFWHSLPLLLQILSFYLLSFTSSTALNIKDYILLYNSVGLVSKDCEDTATERSENDSFLPHSCVWRHCPGGNSWNMRRNAILPETIVLQLPFTANSNTVWAYCYSIYHGWLQKGV